MKNFHKKGWLGIVLGVSIAHYAVADPGAITQKSLTNHACSWYEQQDAALNQTYQRLLSIYAHEKRQQQQLRRAQRAWLRFRDAELTWTIPTGSAAAMCRCMKAGSMTAARQSQLAALLESEEGDVCSPTTVNQAATNDLPAEDFRQH